MTKVFVEDAEFHKLQFASQPLMVGEYSNCTFSNCDFSNADLSEFIFINCQFTGCNISMAKLIKTSFIDIQFTDCKLLGLVFHDCNPFGLSMAFDGCVLNHSSFYRTKMKKSKFANCQLVEVGFGECDLSNSIFDHCDLLNAEFDKTILDKVDFRTAINYSIDPELNRMRKAKFSLFGIGGLLNKYDIVIE